VLYEFRVENHRSIRDEQALTMAAGQSGDATDVRLRQDDAYGEKLLPAAVLYGANASGKSNVLSALAFMRDAVHFSHAWWEPESGIPRSPFAWGPKRREPSTFEVSFSVRNCRYEYGFSLNDEIVEEEWLYAWPNGRKQTWFERDGVKFDFGNNLSGPNEIIQEVTRPNALFLSVATQHNHPQLTEVYSWFHRITIPPENIQGRTFAPLLSDRSIRYQYSVAGNSLKQRGLFEPAFNAGAIAQIRQLLRTADTGIVDMRVIDDEDASRKMQFKGQRIQLKHNQDDDDSWLDYDDESQGTRTIVQMAVPILRSLEQGGLLLVDELESSLHPLLGLRIVEMFCDPATNPRNAQIIFTTHDTNLLGTTLGEPPLRRDQIWFTEKGKDGASRLYPLTDYKPRKSENLERGYLQGRYGGVPFLGNASWNVE
jgi:predicted ATPase